MNKFSTIFFHFRHILFLHDLLIHLFFPFHMSDHFLAFGNKSFSPRLWNSLPPDTRNSSSLPIFCSRLKTHLFYKKNLNKLQLIQNSLARVITNTSKYQHIKPTLKKLLQFITRIKICLLTFLIFSGILIGCIILFPPENTPHIFVTNQSDYRRI